MVNKMDEIILVVPRKEVFNNEELTFQGVINSNTNKEQVNKIVKGINDNLQTMRRGDAEDNPDFKQPIPYAVLKRGNQVYGYTRLEGGGETRLHGNISLGLGGHMNEIPNLDNFTDIVMENLQRELVEEVNITSIDGSDITQQLDIIGLINDDENEVGKVHIGILAFIELSTNTEVTVNEVEQLKGEWFTKEELIARYDKLENWSKFVADIL